jgi:predicted DNA repair protein MutK
VPSALTISYFAPAAILPLLMAGGVYLCFEGFEKIAHKLSHSSEADNHQAALSAALADAKVDLLALEEEKIKGAIRTDFILSAEIIVIALGTVAGAAFSLQATVVSSIALLMTVGVYGLVAGIVKLDDAGLHLSRQQGGGFASLQRSLGRGILRAAPYLMKSLSVVGTAAMFLVGGGMLVHGIPGSHDYVHAVVHAAETLPGVGGALAMLAPGRHALLTPSRSSGRATRRRW